MNAAKLWWLPGTLFALTGVVSCVGSMIWGNPGLFVPIGVVFFIIAGMNLRRRAPR
jgi:hypothetical protein